MTMTSKPKLALIAAALGFTLIGANGAYATNSYDLLTTQASAHAPEAQVVEANFKLKTFKKFHGHQKFKSKKFVTKKKFGHSPFFTSKKFGHSDFGHSGFKKKVFVKKKFF